MENSHPQLAILTVLQEKEMKTMAPPHYFLFMLSFTEQEPVNHKLTSRKKGGTATNGSSFLIWDDQHSDHWFLINRAHQPLSDCSPPSAVWFGARVSVIS